MNIFCRIFGHKYSLLRHVNSYLHELQCERCKREFAINEQIKVVLPMDYELKHLHDSIISSKNIKYIPSEVKCDICCHQWVAVYQLGTEKLQCPNCNNMAMFEHL